MAELTRKDLGEIVTESLGPFAKAVQKDLGHLDTKIEVKTDKLDNRLAKVELELRETRQDTAEVRKDVRWIKENASELFVKLDRLIALFEKNEQEVLMLSAHVKRLEERIERLESKRR